MATQPERINMAENPTGATGAINPVSPTSASRESPVQITSHFDLNRRDYQTKTIGKDVIFTDPLTGVEVARIPKMEGGAGEPLSPEITALLEKTKTREADPQYWMHVLQELHNLPATERGNRKSEYDGACKRLALFAHDEKLFGNSPAVTIIEEQFAVLEKQEIETGTRTKEEKEELQDSLDLLSAQERELTRVRNSLGLREKDSELFTKAQWDELEDREKTLIEEIAAHMTAISGKVSQDFLDNREKLINKIAEEAKFDADLSQQKKQEELRELQDQPKDEEIALEKRFLEDKPITERPPDTPLLPKLLARLYKLEEQMRVGSLDSDQQTQLEQDRISLAWYFHKARRLGVLNDLEKRLDQDYYRFVQMLSSHAEVDMESGRRRTVPGRVFSEVQDKIIETLENLVDRTRSQYIEHPSRWEFHRRRGISQAEIAQLQGIREEFIRRAFPQMEDALFNMSQGGDDFRIDRISGEWNVYRLEKRVRGERESQEAQERSASLFRHEHYYTIELTGRNIRDIETGADQAADYIIRSATTFSLEVVRQRMELLTAGIDRTKGVIESEIGSEEEAKKIIQEIQRAVTNKLDFYILDWLSGNLLMDQFAAYYSDRFRQDGDQKIKVIPAMNDGQTGLAIHWLLSPMYRLYHRPQGFKGQLYDDDQTHKFMREKMKEQIIKKLMEYELKGSRSDLKNGPTLDEFLKQFDHKGIIPLGIIPEDMIPPDMVDHEGKKDPTQYFKNLTWEKRDTLFKTLTAEQREQLFSLFDRLTPDEKVDIRRFQYSQVLDQLQAKERNGAVMTFGDLAALRLARQQLAQSRQHLQGVRAKAESAFTTADRVLNIFGEAAFLSAPSIVMENDPEVVRGPNGEIIKRGDFISIQDYVLVLKFAILTANHQEEVEISGKKYQVKDNQALIRWRSKMFIKAWKEAGLNRERARGEYIKLVEEGYRKIGSKPPRFMLELAQGFEETGLTRKEWEVFKNIDQQFREKGYQIEVGGYNFEKIIKKDWLQPVLNNFLADYKSSMSEFNDPNVIEKAARGRMVSIDNVRKRLGFTGRKRLEGTTQQEIDEYTQRIEDSRSFDAEVERLAYFAATHNLSEPPLMLERGKPVYKFSADRVDYGYQRSWGVKRLHHLKAFWLTNLRRTVPRAADLVYAMPFSLTSLRRELAFDSFLQMCWEVGKMESIDNPSLIAMGDRHKAMGVIRGGAEGSISDQQWKKVWGFWEKPLVDANSLWKLVHFVQGKTAVQSLEKATRDPRGTISPETRESIINHLQETTFSRFMPILVATEKSYGEDRQALSSGSGYEENAKFALRFLEWLMSDKSGDDREQGGLQVQKEIVDILKLITTPDSYREGASLWDEFWRKQTPSHNPRLPNNPPKPTYVAG